MGLLPKNQPQIRPKTDRFSIWVMGAAGVGKTTFATTWPSPFMINTDGNYKQFDTPSAFVEEVMYIDGEPNPIHGFEYIERLVDEFIEQKGQKGGYETIVIDLLEDVIRLCDRMVAKQNGEKDFAQDVPWGKGNKLVTERVKKLVTKLNSSDLNVVYLSHMVQVNTKDLNGKDLVQFVPKEIKSEMLSMIAGRVQLMCALETTDYELTDENGNYILDEYQQVQKETIRILNWEKSERLPSVVQRFPSLTQYCLAGYNELMEVVNGKN